MRGSLASPKREQSCVYCTMSSLWAFQNWESCPRSRSDFRRERCRVRVTLQSTGLHHCMGTGLGMLQSLRLCTHPKHLPVLMQPSAVSSPPVWEIAALPPPWETPSTLRSPLPLQAAAWSEAEHGEEEEEEEEKAVHGGGAGLHGEVVLIPTGTPSPRAISDNAPLRVNTGLWLWQ